ncbi:MAG: quinolinate synthase NadA, partial [Candidatus Aminicenantes bacterium]|nr:quinolinate synthase NadA [Candidatus Aminicenantes bacterium]
ARETGAQEVVVATEAGITYRLSKENPGKRFYPAHDLSYCPNMRKITLVKAIDSLETMSPRVVVDEAVAVRARGAIERMVRL